MDYLVWHYRYGLPHLFLLTKEFIRFIFNLFSIRLFLRTLFKPMLSLEGSTRGEVLADAISIIAGNLVLRVMGFAIRLVLIAIGVGWIIVTAFLMTAAAVLWALLPFFVLFSVYITLLAL